MLLKFVFKILCFVNLYHKLYMNKYLKSIFYICDDLNDRDIDNTILKLNNATKNNA